MSDGLSRRGLSTMDGSVFEGLFSRKLKPAGAFRADLKAAGFDPDRPEPRYPEDVMLRCIEVAVRHAFAGQTVESAHAQLGAALVAGYFDTILGRVTGSLMPVLGVATALKRAQKLWNVPHPGMELAVAPEGPLRWSVSFRNRVFSAEMVAGILEAALKRADEGAHVSVIARMPLAGTLRVVIG